MIGAFGEVRKCQEKKTSQLRAVKILTKECMEESQQSQLLDEISILKQLDHPNIVKLYEFFQDEKRYYIVTELCLGGELFDKITKKKVFGEKDAARYFKQILSAVVYCHSHHIVHRDLKPENLLLESDEENANIKVIDFGTSQSFNPDKKMNQKFGTPYYIAPEVLKKDYTEKCDVWSCGVILYILLSGRPPFPGKNEAEIIKQVETGIYHMDTSEWKNVSPLAKDLIRHMLEINPIKRLSSLSALNHKWIGKFENEENIEANTIILDNLRKFRTSSKLEQAAYMYIMTQLMSNKEKRELQKVFTEMDKNHDGTLSREELIDGYTKICGNKQEAISTVNDILAVADNDGSGSIDYSEFLVATSNRKTMLSEEKLKATFDMFDQDKSGDITPDELKSILGAGKNISEDVWKEMIKEVDQNGDGKITYLEFKNMMLKFADAKS